jgi:hypothetical protein
MPQPYIYWLVNGLVILATLVVAPYLPSMFLRQFPSPLLYVGSFAVSIFSLATIFTWVPKERQKDLATIVFAYAGLCMITVLHVLIDLGTLFSTPVPGFIRYLDRYNLALRMLIFLVAPLHCAILELVPWLKRFRQQYILSAFPTNY